MATPKSITNLDDLLAAASSIQFFVEEDHELYVLHRLIKIAQQQKEDLEYVAKACLCERFVTHGFDYDEEHSRMGKQQGKRWVSPQLYAKESLARSDAQAKEVDWDWQKRELLNEEG